MKFFNFSETSNEPFYKSKKNNQNGGFLDFCNYSKLIFEAISQNNWAALSFMIKSSEIKTMNYKDSNEQTILHHLVNNYKKDSQVPQLISSILSRSDIKDIINVQDKNGNTALHLAVIADLDILCDDLVKAGASKSIRNNAGLYIESETETENLVNPNSNSPQSVQSDSVFISKKELEKTKDQDSQFVNKLMNSLTNTNAKNSTDTSEARGFTELMNSTGPVTGPIRTTEMKMRQSNNYSEFSNLINTSEFINDLVSKYNTKQTGGRNSRKLNTENGMSMIKTSSVDLPSSSDSTEEEKNSMSEMSELSRMINNQATEIHERSVKKIMELLNVSEQEARTMKAFIYNEVKSKNPELNNFDRAVEMEKRITKEYLESIESSKLKELSDVIASKQKEKEESMKVENILTETMEKTEKPKKETKETKAVKEIKSVKETKATKTKEKKETKAKATKATKKSKKESSLSLSNYEEDDDDDEEDSEETDDDDEEDLS